MLTELKGACRVLHETYEHTNCCPPIAMRNHLMQFVSARVTPHSMQHHIRFKSFPLWNGSLGCCSHCRFRSDEFWSMSSFSFVQFVAVLNILNMQWHIDSLDSEFLTMPAGSCCSHACVETTVSKVLMSTFSSSPTLCMSGGYQVIQVIPVYKTYTTYMLISTAIW